MKIYGLLLKRDIGKNPWNFLMILVILLFSYAASYAETIWLILFVILSGSPLLTLSEHNGRAFSMLLPKAKHFEFNYAVVFSSVFCSVFSLSISHTFSEALWVFSLIYLCLIAVSLLFIRGDKEILGKVLSLIIIGVLAVHFGIKYQWFLELGSYFTLDSIAPFQTILTTVFLLLSAGCMWLLRKSFMQRVELNPEKLTFGLIAMNSKLDIANEQGNKGVIQHLWQRYLTISNQLFGFLMVEKRLHQGLYPQFLLSNGINAAFVLLIIVTSLGFPVFSSLTNSPQESWTLTKYLGICLFLSLTVINLAHSFDFVSNRKLMAYLWLTDGSKSRKNYMSNLAKLILARQLSSLSIFSVLTLGLSYFLLGSIQPSLVSVVLAGCMTTIVQVAFVLNVAISQNYTAGLRYATLAFTLISFSISWSVLTNSNELATVLTGFGLVALVFSWYNWRNANLELV